MFEVGEWYKSITDENIIKVLYVGKDFSLVLDKRLGKERPVFNEDFWIYEGVENNV